MRRTPRERGAVNLVTILIIIAIVGVGALVGMEVFGSHLTLKTDGTGNDVPILGGGGGAGPSSHRSGSSSGGSGGGGSPTVAGVAGVAAAPITASAIVVESGGSPIMSPEASAGTSTVGTVAAGRGAGSRFLDGAQLALAGLSVVDPTQITNVADALISVGRGVYSIATADGEAKGHFAAAGTAAAAMIPIVGTVGDGARVAQAAVRVATHTAGEAAEAIVKGRNYGRYVEIETLSHTGGALKEREQMRKYLGQLPAAERDKFLEGARQWAWTRQHGTQKGPPPRDWHVFAIVKAGP